MRTRVSQWDDWNIDIMVAISQAESHCNMDTVGDKNLTYQKNGRTYGYSIGALQVRILPGREHCEQLENYWQCAHDIWKSQGYRAWSVYKSNKYLQYM